MMKKKEFEIKKSFIFDSGPLLILLALNYARVENILKIDDFIEKVYSKIESIPNKYIGLIEFFDKIDTIYTTPHVIGEMLGLVRSRIGFDNIKEKKFWEISINFLKKKRLTEELITLITLSNDEYYNHLISEIGFVDSELIKFAKESKMSILSIDKRTLKKEAIKKNVEVFIIDDDIYLYLD